MANFYGTDIQGGTFNYVEGGYQDDTINGAASVVQVIAYGGQGVDGITGGTIGDILDGGADTAFGGADNDTLYAMPLDAITANGDAGNDLMAGSNVNDTLNGGDNDDTLFGNLGNDTLNGGNGSDAIAGYWGNDTITGGSGADFYNLIFDVRAGEFDTILDWSNADDFLILPTAYSGVTTFGGYVGGAYALIILGSSYYAVYASGATAADLQASTSFA